MAQLISDYFSPGWREQVLECPCGWCGNSREARMELQDTVTDYACPVCEATVLIVAHPDLDLVTRAAAAGNAEARMQLDIVEEARRHFGEQESPPD